MKTRVVGGVMVAAFCAAAAFGQVGVWQNHTSMQEVRSVARAGTTFWAATSGGLYAWQEGTTIYRRLTSADGLQSTDVTAVAVDKNGDIWSGASTGIVHVYTPSTGRIQYITDIANDNEVNKRINRIVIAGDTALICTNFGLSVFRISLFQFGDTYRRFGTLTGNVRVAVSSAAIFDGRIWATVSDGTTHRVASGSLSNPNLLPPGAWTLESLGIPPAIPRALAVFNNTLYSATSSGLFALQGGTWVAHDSLIGRSITDITASATLLAIAGGNNIVNTIAPNNVFAQYGTIAGSPVNAITLGATDNPVIATADAGLMTYQAAWSPHFPNGPSSNQFLSVAVDPDGNVWGATGIDGNGKGFYRFDGKSWISYNRQNSPLPTNDFYRVSIDCNGDAWIASWGRGVVHMPRGTTVVDTTRIYGRNVGLSNVDGVSDSSYVVVGPGICDNNGNMWMTVMKAANKRPLAVRRSTGTWTTVPVSIGGTPQSFLSERTIARALAVDAANNIWATAVVERKGIISMNNRGSTTDSLAEVWLTTTSTSGRLPSDDVTTIVTDRDNNIWIGTDRGVAIILDPVNPTRTEALASYRPATGYINSIAVDPLNQKWVATNEGVLLLSRDGTQTLAQYTVQSTGGKLISNEVKDVAVDPKTGTVYFATTGGLASLTTSAVQPKEDFETITVSPNPYRIPSPVPLSIDGLVENSRIKILTIDGHLVRELETPGGRIGFWDGKDMDGKDVASGIYLVVAYSETDKDKVGTGKVAVLRR